MASVSLVVETVSKAVTAVAVMVGGGWAYLKFVRGRVFKRRGELGLDWRIHRRGGHDVLLLTVTLRNIGLSRLPLHPFGRVVRLYRGRVTDGLVSWEQVDLLPVFADHEWLEPQEAVHDTVALAVPAWAAGGGELLRAVAKVWAAKRWRWSDGSGWTAGTVITVDDQESRERATG